MIEDLFSEDFTWEDSLRLFMVECASLLSQVKEE
jgi:hypothetical protein